MRKVLCTILAVVMMFTASTTAFAATIGTVGGSDSVDVKGKYISAAHKNIYSVDVTWGAMEFDYHEGGQTWNTTSHKWESDTTEPAGWTVNNSSNTITLANNSSTAVKASFAFAAKDTYTNLTGTFSYNSAALTSALELELPAENTAAKTYVVSFTPNGEIPNTHSTSEYTTMGTITITLV